MEFIVTNELKRLGRWLRIAGFDTAYFESQNLSRLSITAYNARRIILTSNSKVAPSREPLVIHIRSDAIREQLRQVFDELKIEVAGVELFSRCSLCNVELVEVAKAPLKGKVPPFVYKTQDSFVQCPRCKKIYWQATHWGHAREFLAESTP